MKISLFVNKSVEENASIYFDRAKKARKKLEGAEKALRESEESLEKLSAAVETEKREREELSQKKQVKKEWFEKFRWFWTSGGLLVIAGRDATTNEIIIKKHTEEHDLVFHTDMAGSPFGVIKSEGNAIDPASVSEAAQFVACYSKAWQLGLSRAEVFYVNPGQVSKTPPPGEFIQKGSFMIYGKKNSMSAELALYIGVREDGRIMSGPKDAVMKHCVKSVRIIPGKEKSSDTAKKIRLAIGGELDDIVRVIPGGGAKIGG